MSRVWFGTKRYMQWVIAPSVDVSAGKQGFSAEAAFLNGGAWVRRSKAAAKTYNMSWDKKARDQIRPILDYADGIYGDDYIYYVDPFAANQNALPTYWASPYVNYYDGPLVIDGVRPTLITNATSTNGYPVESVQYKVTSTSKVPTLFVPIPENYTLHLGAHGTLVSGNASVRVTPVINALSLGTPVDLTLLATSSTTRTNYTLSQAAGFIGVNISFASTSTGVIQIDGMIAQLLPTGETVPSGGFISGQGASGMEFRKYPSVSQYSVAFDMIGATAELIETEAWQWQ